MLNSVTLWRSVLRAWTVEVDPGRGVYLLHRFGCQAQLPVIGQPGDSPLTSYSLALDHLIGLVTAHECPAPPRTTPQLDQRSPLSGI